MVNTKNVVTGAMAACVCFCTALAFTLAVFAVMASWKEASEKPLLGSQVIAEAGDVLCVKCPAARCADEGYALSVRNTTEEHISQSLGLVDCLCTFCEMECSVGVDPTNSSDPDSLVPANWSVAEERSFLAISGEWTEQPTWYKNVEFRNGTCDVLGNCTWSSVCRP